MTVIASRDFECQVGDTTWATVPAGTYWLETAVRAGSDVVEYMPGRTVIVPASGAPLSATNYLSLPWMGIFFVLSFAFYCGLRVRCLG